MCAAVKENRFSYPYIIDQLSVKSLLASLLKIPVHVAALVKEHPGGPAMNHGMAWEEVSENRGAQTFLVVHHLTVCQPRSQTIWAAFGKHVLRDSTLPVSWIISEKHLLCCQESVCVSSAL